MLSIGSHGHWKELMHMLHISSMNLGGFLMLATVVKGSINSPVDNIPFGIVKVAQTDCLATPAQTKANKVPDASRMAEN